MLPLIELREYLDTKGRSLFGQWFDRLDVAAAARVTTSLTRLRHGNWSSVKGVGGRVYEVTIDFGPGYRVYFGKDGENIVILLGGGTKKRQSQDIADAQTHWSEYKKRKK